MLFPLVEDSAARHQEDIRGQIRWVIIDAKTVSQSYFASGELYISVTGFIKVKALQIDPCHANIRGVRRVNCYFGN